MSGPCRQGEYGSDEVYYAEIAIFRAICANAGDLFTVGPGESFRCDVDVDAFNRFAARLMATDHQRPTGTALRGGSTARKAGAVSCRLTNGYFGPEYGDVHCKNSH